MDIYLPIAELSVNLLLLLTLGGGVGFLSGMFGVGGGFLITPLLIFVGIPPPVAVGTQALQVLASSISGVQAHLRRKAVDLRMGAVLAAGGFVGSGLGILLFKLLQALGQIDSAIAISYVLLLGTIGTLMLVESVKTFWRSRRDGQPRRAAKPPKRARTASWPLKLRFPASKLYLSALVPAGVGLFVGVLSAVMGIGGGFVLVPAMIYLIGMPTGVVVGTSLLQVSFVSALTVFLHATQNQTVDIVLGLVLTAGGVIGAQFGSRAGTALKAEQLRLLLALLVLAVGGKLAFDLVIRPDDLYSLAN